MALDYDGASAGIFTRIGKHIKYINAYKTYASSTFVADSKAIVDLYEAADLTRIVDDEYDLWREFQDNITTMRQQLAGFVDLTITDKQTVVDEIPGLTSQDIASVLPALATQMTTDTESILKCTVTVGTVTAGAANVGNGTIILTKLLDGYNAPVAGGIPYIGNAGLNSELAVTAETMVFVVTADSYRDGATEGAESISWTGGVAGPPLDWEYEGSGPGPSLIVANNGFSIIQNGDFENFTSDVPDSWDLDLGTATTHVADDTSAGNFYRGTTGLKLLGTGAIAEIKLSQTLAPSLFRSRRCYNVSVRVKASATIAAGDLLICFVGTGYTASSTEKVSIAAAALPTSWTLYSFFIVLPAVIPSDWEIKISWSGTPTNAKSVWLDSLAIAEVVYHGGIGAVAVAGASPLAVGDRWTAAITNDNAGVFQRFFREYYRFQLPSSASPTNADALAT